MPGSIIMAERFVRRKFEVGTIISDFTLKNREDRIFVVFGMNREN